MTSYANSIRPGRSYKAGDGWKLAIRLVIVLAVLTVFLAVSQAFAQSTFGSVVGTVKDPDSQVVVGAVVTLTDKGTGASRQAATDDSGTFSFVNLNPGTYQLVIETPGFEKVKYSQLNLQARETRRVDSALKIATQSQTISVVETAGAVITTDEANITATKTGRELLDLPVAISSRGSGSTSAISTLTTQPGVQTDGTNISIAGAKPSLLSVSIDGISSMSVRTSAPINELFPSFNSIAEIKVSQTLNNAEYAGVSDITTVSKSGTNRYHGGLFHNHQNAALNAGDPFAASKPALVMNNFGGYFGGPVRLPHLYNGKDKTFFFMSYEGLRLPRETTQLDSVPSVAWRNGDLSNFSGQIYDAQGNPFAGNIIPADQISPVSQKIMQYLYPMPNTGAANANANNYVVNYSTPIRSEQGDIRIDQRITDNQLLYGRFSYKTRDVEDVPTGSPLIGSFQKPEKDYSFTAAYNYVISPTLINEIRAGYNGTAYSTTYNMNASILSAIGITGVPDLPTDPAVPDFRVTGFLNTGGGGSSRANSNTFQAFDNVTWSRGTHMIKFGADYRYMTVFNSNVFGSTRLGQYQFNGSSDVGTAINNPWAEFLLGYPDHVRLSDVLAPDMNGIGKAYALFIQDDWKVTPSFTLNYGLRWEYHPMFTDKYYNSADFLPDWTGTVNDQTVHGAVVMPNAKSLALAHPRFAQAIYPTPILTAAEAGLPESLRYTTKRDFAPRIGFAWRPFGNDKTVIRGGYGRYFEFPLGMAVVGGWAVSASAVTGYQQQYDAGSPALSFPSPFPDNLASTGTQTFDYAVDPNYQDPVINQWTLTMERDLGFGTGLRVSYVGSHTGNLPVRANLNQVQPNSQGYGAVAATRPFPLFDEISWVENGARANYNALTVEANHRYINGLQFGSSYTFARNISSEAGATPSAFTTEQGGRPSNTYDINLDYGNVAFTRRHRFLTTFLYEMPFGRGKRMRTGSKLLDGVIGNWNLGGILLLQSGPFLTPTATTDPSGTDAPGISRERPSGRGSGSFPVCGWLQSPPVHQSGRICRAAQQHWEVWNGFRGQHCRPRHANSFHVAHERHSRHRIGAGAIRGAGFQHSEPPKLCSSFHLKHGGGDIGLRDAYRLADRRWCWSARGAADRPPHLLGRRRRRRKSGRSLLIG